MHNHRSLTATTVMFALAACSSAATLRPVDAGSTGIHASVSPAIAGEANTVDIESSRAPLAAVALDMPDMQMPPRRYELHPHGAALYEASNVEFTMAGIWRVSVLDAQGKRISSFAVRVR